MSSTITDYFSPRAKKSRMERCDGDKWSDDEWFQGATQQYVEARSHSEGCTGKEKGDTEELEWSDEEWFQGATQQYMEDRNPSEECVGREGGDTGELLQREEEGKDDGGGIE